MNVRLLIDAIVRQTMVLIAQLATSGGLRAPLAHVAGQAFLELARELEAQGVPKKVSADMFGMALRTYQRRMQRLSQSRTDRGRSLWEAVLEFIESGGVVSREEVLRRFRYDDEASLKGVLRDLVESGLVFSSGSGRNAVYRVATREEARRHPGGANDGPSLEAFVWLHVYRQRAIGEDALAAECGLSRAQLAPVVEALVAQGRIERVHGPRGEELRTRGLVLGLENPAGWEAAVLDQFSAVVQTITRKLALDQRASLNDEIGGSTYHFELWRGHPLEGEVLGELRRFRERMTRLRERADEHNLAHPHDGPKLRVTAYYGQSVMEDDDGAVGNRDDDE